MSLSPKASAVLLMCASALVIPVVDTIAKWLTAVASPLFLVWARYAFGAASALIVFRAPGRALSAFRAAWILHLARSALLVGAMTCFYEAISDVPVATALGGYFTGPVVAALFSILFLREAVSAWKLMAVFCGFAGALLILRPESGGSAAATLALLSGALSGVYLVLTRAASLAVRAEDNVLIQSVVGAALVTPFAITNVPELLATEVGLLCLMGALSFAAHALFLGAFRTLEVNTLAPLAYLELAVAAILGWAVFGDLPQRSTWFGIVLVVTGGLLVVLPPQSRSVWGMRERITRR